MINIYIKYYIVNVIHGLCEKIRVSENKAFKTIFYANRGRDSTEEMKE
jgi:hypothetical protein